MSDRRAEVACRLFGWVPGRLDSETFVPTPRATPAQVTEEQVARSVKDLLREIREERKRERQAARARIRYAR